MTQFKTEGGVNLVGEVADGDLKDVVIDAAVTLFKTTAMANLNLICSPTDVNANRKAFDTYGFRVSGTVYSDLTPGVEGSLPSLRIIMQKRKA